MTICLYGAGNGEEPHEVMPGDEVKDTILQGTETEWQN
jgi:hypothetical protein